jgi:FkbM family methyltransferase
MLRTIGLYDYYRRVVGVRSIPLLIRARASRRPYLLEMKRRDVEFPFYLRIPSSDVVTFEQIFLLQEYRFDAKISPRTIVDAGANIGLSSIYFSNRFPGAKIIAIEPEDGNFEMLRRNTMPYKNIIAVRGALWHENENLQLVDPGVGDWGFMTQQAHGGVEERVGAILQEVRGMTVSTVMKEQGLERIDILKMDIEGAEREVFNDPSSWLGKVDAMIVELHERMKSGCNRSFYRGTQGFDDEWLDGENVYLTRRAGCVTRRSLRPRGPS